jgi:hypothetical protein
LAYGTVAASPTYIRTNGGLVEPQLGVLLDSQELCVVAELVGKRSVAENLPHCGVGAINNE